MLFSSFLFVYLFKWTWYLLVIVAMSVASGNSKLFVGPHHKRPRHGWSCVSSRLKETLHCIPGRATFVCEESSYCVQSVVVVAHYPCIFFHFQSRCGWRSLWLPSFKDEGSFCDLSVSEFVESLVHFSLMLYFFTLSGMALSLTVDSHRRTMYTKYVGNLCRQCKAMLRRSQETIRLP